MPLTFRGADLCLGVVDGLSEGNTGGPGVLGGVAVGLLGSSIVGCSCGLLQLLVSTVASSSTTAGGAVWDGSSLVCVGMGMLLRVCRWCTKRVPRITVGDVVSLDVDGVPTLGAGMLSTLDSGLLVKMLVSFRSAVAWRSLALAVGGVMALSSRSMTSAAKMVSSPSEMVGSWQFVGYSL